MPESPSPARYLLAYLLWVLTIGISLPCAMLARTVYQYIIVFAGWSRYTIRALDNFGILTLLLLLVAVVVIAEHAYRTGLQQKRLFFRFSTFTVIEVSVLLFLQTMLLIMQLVNGSIDLIAMGLLALMAIVLWLLVRWRTRLNS